LGEGNWRAFGRHKRGLLNKKTRNGIGGQKSWGGRMANGVPWVRVNPSMDLDRVAGKEENKQNRKNRSASPCGEAARNSVVRVNGRFAPKKTKRKS